ncbi:MAG TPA: serine/threonine-protein kinase [Pirellulales bacterium]
MTASPQRDSQPSAGDGPSTPEKRPPRHYYVGPYQLIGLIGAGAASRVYLAQHRWLRHRAAVKIALRGKASEEAERRARFLREAELMHQLDHPNVVRLYDAGHQGTVNFLALEYVAGVDLKRLVETRGPLPARQAANIVRQAAAGLAYLHRQGLYHRDVKPANIQIGAQNVAKLLDLGTACSIRDCVPGRRPSESDMVGTIDFMAPEQALNVFEIDGRSDIYSLGCTLYFALTGRAPFPDGPSTRRLFQHQMEEPAALAELRPGLSLDLIAICQRMMAKKPADRFATMSSVRQALVDWLAQPSKVVVSPEPDSCVLAEPTTVAALGASTSNILAEVARERTTSPVPSIDDVQFHRIPAAESLQAAPITAK